MADKILRDIFYYKYYYLDFFHKLRPEVKKKLKWTLQLIAILDRVPEKYFKHITGSTGLYEIRVEVGSDIFGVFSFFRQSTARNLSKRVSEKDSEDTEK